jgi:LacI family transcriptional regulator
VSIKHLDAGRLAAKHLIDLGHKRFAFIGSPSQSNPRALARLQGVKIELGKNGLLLNPGAVTSEPHLIDSGRAAVDKILAHQPDTTAIICTSDYYTLGVLRALHDLNIKIPRDISVVSFNNNDFSAFTLPAITTVDLHYAKVGEAAADMIMKLLNKEIVSSVMIEPELCIRETSGPAKQEKSLQSRNRLRPILKNS